MNLLKKLGFKKADEREVYVTNKALKFSWLFYSIALILWAGAEFIQNGPTSVYFILLIIIFAGQGVHLIFRIYYTKKTNGRYEK